MATEITTTLTFTERELSFKEELGYNVVFLKECLLTNEIGRPQLPLKIINFVIPPDAKVENVVVTSNSVEIRGEYNIFPAQAPKNIGEDWHWTEPNSEFYNSSRPYPEQVFELADEGFMAGNRIAGVLIYPLQYIPVEKKLVLHTEITVTLHYSPATSSNIHPCRTLPENEKTFKKMIKNITVNTGDVGRFSPRTEIVEPSIPEKFAPTQTPSQTGSPVNYVIITSDELLCSFQMLADWKTKKGVPAVVKTLSWIRSHYDGTDDQERIRNFIKDAYMNWGTAWFLIGGDINIVPVREASIRRYTHDVLRITTDLYYACLDGDWNADGDDKFAEEFSDSADLYPEVFVGRASVENMAEADIFVSKIINYEKTHPNEYLTKALFLAGNLYQTGDAKKLCDSIADYHMPGYFKKTRLYECDGNLRHDQVIDSLNLGYGLIYSQNHGGQDWLRLAPGEHHLTKDDIATLINNDRQSIWYGVNCGANKFQYDCLSERFLNNPNGGGIAYIGSTSWDAPWSNFILDECFFDYLFGEDLYRIGVALTFSKIQFITFSQQPSGLRIAQFGKMLLGDPEMPVWTNNPQPTQVEHPNQIPLGSHLFNVRVYSVTQTIAPLPQALVCVMKDNEFYAYGYTDGNGEITFEVCPESPGEISIVVTKHNCQTYEGTCQTIPDSPYLSFSSKEINDLTGNGNEIPEAGEIILLPLWLKNMGFGTATNVTATFTTNDTLITITQPQSFFDYIEQEQTKLGEPPFEFEIDPSCPDNHQVNFALDIISDQGLYKDTVIIVIQAPQLLHFRHIVDDDEIPPSQGNGNSIAEKEETIELPFILRNEGFGQADDVTAILGCDDPEVIILNNTVGFGAIPSRQEKENVDNHLLFTLSADWQGNIPFNLTITDRYGHLWYDTFYLRKPTAPVDLSASPGRDYIDLTWGTVVESNLLGYNVYRSEEACGPYFRVNETPITNGTYFNDFGLQRAYTYYYVVSSVDSSMNESFYSPELESKTNPFDLFGWPRTMKAGGFASIVACDFDPSYPGLEVIAADYDGTIYMWHYDGTGVINPDGVYAITGKSIYASPALADLDGDGQLEMVTLHTDFDSGHCYVKLWDYPTTCPWEKKISEWSVATPVIGDVRGLGKIEILVATSAGNIYLYDGLGSGGLFVQANDEFGVSSPALGDIDGDGLNEIVIGGKNAIYAWRSNGDIYEPIYAQPGNIPNANFGSVSIGDIVPEKPGREISVVATNYGSIYVFQSDGVIATGWPKYVDVAENGFASTSLFPNLSNGLNIAIGGFNGIYAFNNTGNLLTGFPAFRRRYSSSTPAIGNITNDDIPEIIIGSGLEDDRLYAFDLQGNPILGFPIPAEYPIASTPTITDIDFDELTEILVASDDKKVYVFDLSPTAQYQPENCPWPMFRHDIQRTGCFSLPYDLSTETRRNFEQIGLTTSLSPLNPNPFRSKTSIKYQIGKDCYVKIGVYDVTGRMVKKLINANHKPGYYNLNWDGSDNGTKILPYGIYFLRLETDEEKYTEKVVLLR